MTYLLDFPPELFEVSTEAEWDVAYRESLASQAEYLGTKNIVEIKLSHAGENFLSSEGTDILSSFCRKELDEINDIEIKYSRFFGLSVRKLLMDLEEDLRGIIDLISLKDDFEEKIYLSLIRLPIYSTVKHIATALGNSKTKTRWVQKQDFSRSF